MFCTMFSDRSLYGWNDQIKLHVDPCIYRWLNVCICTNNMLIMYDTHSIYFSIIYSSLWNICIQTRSFCYHFHAVFCTKSFTFSLSTNKICNNKRLIETFNCCMRNVKHTLLLYYFFTTHLIYLYANTLRCHYL